MKMGKKGIKSWYVRLEKVKTSNMEYLKYLLDKRRHKGQDITPYKNEEELKLLMEELEADTDFYRSSMKRGGHIPTSLYAGVLTLPTDIDLKPEIYKKICEDTFREFFRYALINQKKNAIKEPTEAQIDDLMNKTLLVQHKGNHVHFGIPKIIREPRMVLNYSFKRMSHNLKRIFEEKVFNHTKISRVDYMFQEAEEKQNQRSKRADNKQKDINNQLKETIRIAEKKLLNKQKQNVEQFEEAKAKMINDINEQNELKRFEILYDKAIIENEKFDLEKEKLEFEAYQISREAKLDKQELFNDKESAVKDTIDDLISKETENKGSVSVEEIKAVVIELIEVIKLGNLGLLDMKQFKTIDIQLSKGHTTRALSQVKTIKNALNSTSFNEASKITV